MASLGTMALQARPSVTHWLEGWGHRESVRALGTSSPPGPGFLLNFLLPGVGRCFRGSSHVLPAGQGAESSAQHGDVGKYLNPAALPLQLLKLGLCLGDLLLGNRPSRSQLVLCTHPGGKQQKKARPRCEVRLMPPTTWMQGILPMPLMVGYFVKSPEPVGVPGRPGQGPFSTWSRMLYEECGSLELKT